MQAAGFDMSSRNVATAQRRELKVLSPPLAQSLGMRHLHPVHVLTHLLLIALHINLQDLQMATY